MAAINQEDLLGSIIPDVYISRITLETSGTPLREDNPHIDHEREKISQREEEYSDSLIVKLDLILKEKVTDDLIGTWLDNQDLGKYLQIKVFQSTDEDLTSFLAAGSDAIELIEPRKTINSRDLRFRLAAKTLKTTTVRETIRKLQRRSDIRILSVKKDVQQNKSALSQFKSRVDDDGNTVYDITYRAQFEIPTANPEHLAYFAITSFDIQELAKDFDIEFDASSVKDMNGKIAADVVIEDYEVVSRTHVFYDRQGKIWAGPVHQMDNGQWMSKSRPQEGSVPLTRTLVANAKVQDFRNIREIEKLAIDFSIVEKEVYSNNITKIFNNDMVESKREENYFSDMFLSRDMDGNAKFFFSIDMEKAILENSLFGRLIKKTPKLRKQMIRDTQIRHLRVYRQRVREDFSLARSGTPKNVTPFDTNEAWELVVSCGERYWKGFRGNNTEKGSIREHELATTGDLLGVRHFSGMDKTMSDVTDGVYRYVVEMDVQDATINFIDDRIRLLMNAKAELETYLNIGSQPSMSKYLAEVRDPHIDHPSEMAGTDGKTSGMYDPDSNRFTQNFIKTMERKYKGRRRMSAPWVASVSLYLDTLDIFTGILSKSRRNRVKLTNAIYSYVNPRTGNPSGVQAVIRLIDHLATSLGRAARITLTTSPRRYKPGKSQRESIFGLSRSPRKTFMLSKQFNDVFDSEVIKGTGVDYLSRGMDETNNNDGLRIVTANDFLKRIELETLRYFKTTKPDINMAFAGQTITENDTVSATNYTYLTPSRVDLPRRSVVLLEGAMTQKLDNSFPQNSPRVPFRRSVSTTRTVTNLYEGDTTRTDDLVDLQASTLLASSVDYPTDPTGRLNTQGDTTNDPSVTTQQSTEKVFATIGTSLNINIEAVPIKPVVADGEIVTVEVDAPIVFEPAKSVECETPDKLVEEPQSPNKTNFEVEAVNTSFISALMAPAVKDGSFLGTKSTLRKASFRGRRLPYASKSQSFLSFASTLDAKKLTVTNSEEGRRGPTRIIQGLRRNMTEKDFKLMPNQLKALFLQSLGSDAVRKERFVGLNTTDINARMGTQAEINFSYEMINKVEYLETFGRDREGNVLMKEPKWTSLTEEKYNSLIGDSILCRLRPYENPAVSLTQNKGLNIGVYDQHFILVPQRVAVAQPANPIDFAPGTLTGKIIEDLRGILPDVDIRQSTVDDPIFGESNDDENIRDPGNIPIKITVIEKSAIGKDTVRSYDIGDPSAITTPVRDDLLNVQIRDEDVPIAIEVASDVMLAECQANNVELEYTANIQVPADGLLDQIKDAAEKEGLDPIIVEGAIAVSPDETEQPCLDTSPVAPFEEAFSDGIQIGALGDAFQTVGALAASSTEDGTIQTTVSVSSASPSTAISQNNLTTSSTLKVRSLVKTRKR